MIKIFDNQYFEPHPDDLILIPGTEKITKNKEETTIDKKTIKVKIVEKIKSKAIPTHFTFDNETRRNLQVLYLLLSHKLNYLKFHNKY